MVIFFWYRYVVFLSNSVTLTLTILTINKFFAILPNILFLILAGFLFRSKSIFQFFFLYYFYIRLILLNTYVRMVTKLFRLENKIFYRKVVKIIFSDRVCCHLSFFNWYFNYIFCIYFWFFVGFKVAWWFKSFSKLFVFHSLWSFFYSFMFFIYIFTFK